MSRPLPDLSKRGPFPVGALQTEIASPLDPIEKGRLLPAEIWYPALADATNADDPTYDAPHPLGLPHRASTGLAPRSSPAPLIAFSHGNSGLRQQSTFLMTHLASWGFVVIAPDHVGNTFGEMLALTTDEQRREVHLRARSQRPTDLARSIRALLDEDQEQDRIPPLHPTSIGVLGHSYGGWTALKIPALDRRVRAICCLAPASEPFVGRKAFEPGELPVANPIETLVLAGRDDVLVDLESSIRPLLERLGETSRLEIIEGADHFHFCDGIELLHGLHEKNPRANQSRPTRAFSELKGETEMQLLLNERVTRFFRHTLGTDTE
ncbi:MAG: hypothetical protein GY910_16720 [bacterium]|nr:hypothetical protein [Deltaproteobacteria bacterium]MCP4906620.1 hypothetical protein [bacterium]